MTPKQPPERSQKTGPQKPDSGVGYCRPPREHQFKPGRSGNPPGRPKGRKNEDTILQDLFNRKISIRESGRVRRITMLEALLLKFFDDALKGNPKSAAFLLNRFNGAREPDAANTDVTLDDREIIADFAKRLELQLQKRKDKS
jgi:hypothetical protein